MHRLDLLFVAVRRDDCVPVQRLDPKLWRASFLSRTGCLGYIRAEHIRIVPLHV